MYGGSHFTIVAPGDACPSSKSDTNSSSYDSAITKNAALFSYAEFLICCGSPTAFDPALATAIYLLQAIIFTAVQSAPSLLLMRRYET
jgi:hypothetical protein